MVSMSAKRKLGAVASALGVSAASLVAFAGGAMADGRHGHGPGFGRPPMHAPAPPPRFAHGGERHHGHGGGAAVALGLGALFVGAIIASEASRRHETRDYDE